MSSIIEVKQLNFSYDETQQAVKNVSFKIPKGKYTTIIGHNGSGKSTIAKLLIGLLEKKSGDILIDGIQLSELTLNEIRSKVGIVFQNPDNQFIGSTVRDDIAFGLENHQVPTESMAKIIETYAAKVDMTRYLDKEPTNLSGGQKQRVAIASILAMNLKVVILDEATSMLDPQGKQEINHLMGQLNKEENTTIISITHDIEEAAKSDHVIILSEGEVVKMGPPEQVLADQVFLESVHLEGSFGLRLSNQLIKKGIKFEPTIDWSKLVEVLCQFNLKI